MRLLILGLGYSAARVADVARSRGAAIMATSRDGRGATLSFSNGDSVAAAIGAATHILSSIPPAEGAGDPALALYGDSIGDAARAGAWIGYLSSTGVYGDAGGAWVDETAPTGGGRRRARADADAAWLAMDARVFRLPGIYGPGRSALDRVAAGTAHRVDAPGQMFSRIHVDDLAAGVIAGFDAPPGAYHLADDHPCGQNEVIEYAALLLGMAPPPMISIDDLSPAARGFYAENRRVANGRARRVLNWRPRYADYRAGLRALNASTSPTTTSTAPETA